MSAPRQCRAPAFRCEVQILDFTPVTSELTFPLFHSSLFHLERRRPMAQIDWYIEGVEVSNCNCDYACPCQFESSRPTHGDCRGFAAVRIDKGHFGDVMLDGLCGALIYAWPGPIYEGNGECQAIIDEGGDRKQRDTLATVLYGGET